MKRRGEKRRMAEEFQSWWLEKERTQASSDIFDIHVWSNVWCPSADGCLEKIIGFLRSRCMAFSAGDSACRGYSRRASNIDLEVNGQPVCKYVSNYPRTQCGPDQHWEYSISCHFWYPWKISLLRIERSWNKLCGYETTVLLSSIILMLSCLWTDVFFNF